MSQSSSDSSAGSHSDSGSDSESPTSTARTNVSKTTPKSQSSSQAASRVSKFSKSAWSSDSEEDQRIGRIEPSSESESSSSTSDDDGSDGRAGGTQHLAQDSYALLGVPSTRPRKVRPPVEVVAKGNLSTNALKGKESPLDPVTTARSSQWEEEEEDDEDEGVVSAQSSIPIATKDSNDSGSTDAHEISVSDNSTSSMPATTPVKTSNWLNKFLSHKKDHNNVILKPDIIPLNDMFLREFAEFQASHPRPAHKDIFVHGSASVGVEIDSSVAAAVVSSSGLAHMNIDVELDEEKEDELDRKYHEMQRNRLSIASELLEEGEIEAEKEKNFRIRIFNLPYTIDADEIVEIARNLKVKLLNCSMDMDRKTQQPRGSATAEVSAHKDIAKVINRLHGESFGGRAVRVEQLKQTEKRRKSASMGGEARYFANNINVKCNICDAVGHKTADCPEENLAPCHLCAQSGHEAATCPNIICFRCGDYGHSSRSCRKSSIERTILCTSCGSTTHEAKSCPKMLSRSGYVASKNVAIEGDLIRCMVCNALGHALCRRTAHSSDRTVYCPNCGGKGHTIECMAIGKLTCRNGYGRNDHDYRRPSFGDDQNRRNSFGNSSGRVVEIVDNSANRPSKKRSRSHRDGEEEGEIVSDEIDDSMDEFMNHDSGRSQRGRSSGDGRKFRREIEIDDQRTPSGSYSGRRVVFSDERPRNRRNMQATYDDEDADQVPYPTEASHPYQKKRPPFDDFTPLPHDSDFEPRHRKANFRHERGGHRQVTNRYADDDGYVPDVVQQHYGASQSSGGHRTIEFSPHEDDTNRPRKGFKYRR